MSDGPDGDLAGSSNNADQLSTALEWELVRRPIGILMLAAVATIGAIFAGGIVIALVGLQRVMPQVDFVIGSFVGYTAGLTVLAIGAVVLAFGAMGLKPWAWPLGFAWSACAFAVSALIPLLAVPTTSSFQVLFMALGAAALVCLVLPDVRAALRQYS